MRIIHLSNDKKRDAQVGFELNRRKAAVRYETADGKTATSCRTLKSTLANEPEKLQAKYTDLAQALIDGDPEIDMELAGRRLAELQKVYLGADGKAAHAVTLTEHLFAADGTEKGTRPVTDTQSNIALENVPVRWTGKTFPKAEAIRRFVFARSYQIRHVNGLTFDFLYDMAKKLSDAGTMLLLGGGVKGNKPLVLANNGTGYRAFLEGRVNGDQYALILHLTNLELKEISHD